MAFDKFLKRRRQVAIQQVAAPADLVGNVLGDVARPSLERIKTEHADWFRILPVDQVQNDGFEVGALDPRV
jgi:hypothetical protein